MTAALLLAVGASTTANAATISAAGDTFTVSGSGSVPNQTGTVSFTAVFTVISYSTTQISLGIDLTNTTVVPNGDITQAVLTAFGFATTPDSTSATGTTQGVNDSGTDADVFTFYDLGALPSLGQIEVCTQANTIQNQCAGGNINEGLDAGDQDLFVINIFNNGTGFGTSTEITDVGAKFQTNVGSTEFTGDGVPVDGNNDGVPVDGNNDGVPVDGNNDGVPVDGAPEPTSLVLLGSAFAVVANRLRRRSL
jgi:hypothetical protein